MGRVDQEIVWWHLQERGYGVLQSSSKVEVNSSTLPHLFDVRIETEKQRCTLCTSGRETECGISSIEQV